MKVTRRILSGGPSAGLRKELRETLTFLEKLTLAPEAITPDDVTPLRSEGLSERALIDAVYICFGFNVINRIADALDFSIPLARAFAGGAMFLRLFGYKWLSGSLGRSEGDRRSSLECGNANLREVVTYDPYWIMVERLVEGVIAGRGALDRSVREAALSGAEVPGTVGRYIKNIAQRKYTDTNADFVALHREGYSDDQIFEATVSSALGAGLRCRRVGLLAIRGLSNAGSNLVLTENLRQGL